MYYSYCYYTGWNLVWLGGQKEGGRWRWLNYQDMSFTYWSEDQPSGEGDCLVMSGFSKWVDYHCGGAFYSVCMFKNSGAPFY